MEEIRNSTAYQYLIHALLDPIELPSDFTRAALLALDLSQYFIAWAGDPSKGGSEYLPAFAGTVVMIDDQATDHEAVRAFLPLYLEDLIQAILRP